MLTDEDNVFKFIHVIFNLTLRLERLRLVIPTDEQLTLDKITTFNMLETFGITPRQRSGRF